MDKLQQVRACLWGLMLGDALGLPYEGLSAKRLQKLLGPPNKMRFLFGKGMISDDTEHCIMTLQAYIQSQGDVKKFASILAWKFRFWLLGLPAGVGFATARSILKLYLGFPASRSGVYSAGNGPAMRAGILGILAVDESAMFDLVKVSTQLSHTDPRAFYGALAIAMAARCAAEKLPLEVFYQYLQKHITDGEFQNIIQKMQQSLDSGQSTQDFAKQIGGNGVSGYIYQTVPVCLHAWIRYPNNYQAAIEAVIVAGGDTDTTAAIAGSIVGPAVGLQQIPNELRKDILEWPMSKKWIERLCENVNRGSQVNIHFPILLRLPRNLFFLLIVLLHGLRRLLPPY